MDTDDERKILDNMYMQRVYPKLTKDEREALLIYSRGGHRRMNSLLINPDGFFLNKKNLQQRVDLIRKDISYSKNPIDNLVVYHGTCKRILNSCVSVKNNISYLNLKSFVSTSLSCETANFFACLNDEINPLVLKIKLSKGFNALWLRPLSRFPAEDELVLPDDTCFQILGSSVNKYSDRIDVVKVLAIKKR